MNKIIEIYESLGYPMGRYYDRVWKEKLIKLAYDYIESIDKATVRVLDIWGGWGYDLQALKLFLDFKGSKKKLELLLVDKYLENSTDETFKNTKKFSDITYFEDDFTLFSPEHIGWKVDIIISAETIEHIWDIEKELWFLKMNELLHIGWRLLITAPNGSSILKNLLWIFKKDNREVLCGDFDFWISHHKGIPTIYECLSLFLRKWFTVEKFYSTTFSFELRYSFINGILQYIFFITPLNYIFSSSIIYCAVKKSEIDTTFWYNKKENLIFWK